MHYAVLQNGASRSLPNGDAFLAAAGDAATADVIIHLATPLAAAPERRAVLIELGAECLGEHPGKSMGDEGSNVLGFTRYRNGDDPPSSLIELVRQPNTAENAIKTAYTLFETAGFRVALYSDQAGRIIDRLVRPKYNAALRLLDEGLATAIDMDLTCRLGLGYPDGPIERVVRGGLAHHFDVTTALFETYGTAGFAPARRAVVTAARRTGR